MRIQHNIAALNSYRNLITNNNAVSKNLEKLSSGYRINRAGDDAAGLAISEKMRAQITGLETAQKNANDGISLVQTAEGAMTEIHSMLNRMVELASQSANGTYADAVDRENLQKEVASLKDEVNRIADSTNFNGINLLDGSLDSSVTKTVKDATINGLEGMDVVSVMNPDTEGPQCHEDGTGSAKTSFEVDLEGLAWQLGEDYADGTEHVFQLRGVADDGTTSGDKLVGEIKYTLSGKSGGDTVTAKDLAAAIAKVNDGVLKLKFAKETGDTSPIEIEYKVKNEGSKLVFEMTDKGFADAAAVENATDEAKKPGGNAKGLNVFQGNFNFLADYTYTADTTPEADYKYTQTTTPEGYNPMQDSCTSNIKPGNASAGTIRAEAMVNFRDLEIKDGAGVKIGDTYYVWAGSDETLNGEYGDKVKTVDIRDLVDENSKKIEVDAYDPTVASTTFTDLTKALSRLSEAASDNEMFNVQVGKYGDVMIFTERVTNTSDADLTTSDAIKEQLQTFSSVSANVSVKEAGGKDLTLQIGDTSDAFNQLTVSVGDMHVEAMGIADVDISTQAGAQAAVDKIKNAINYVSSTRGDLGAIQNRLDHTINNLSVTTENITAAESRIRDVDMAEEMMAYTKNNILVQASQAMLAQANQIPQGVLQLLQ